MSLGSHPKLESAHETRVNPAATVIQNALGVSSYKYCGAPAKQAPYVVVRHKKLLPNASFLWQVVPAPTETRKALLIKIKYCAAHKIYHALHNGVALALMLSIASRVRDVGNTRVDATFCISTYFQELLLNVFARSHLSCLSKQR